MIYPRNIIGPQFHKGDIVTFVFDGAELILRLPIVPINKDNEDVVSSIKDFRQVKTDVWGQDDQGNRCEQLVAQCWCFEDAISLDDVALSRLAISLVDVGQKKTKVASLLNFSYFEKVVLDGLAYSFDDGRGELHSSSTDNRFFAEQYKRNNVNWLRVKISYDPERLPSPVIFIPLTSSFFVMVSLELQSLHYAGRSNPYSDELLKKFESDLFEDFISHIDLRYTPETIAIIESLKQSTAAGV